MIISVELFDWFNMIESERRIEVGDVPLTIQIFCHGESDIHASFAIFLLRFSLLALEQTNVQ
jgi:hypothetical protein